MNRDQIITGLMAGKKLCCDRKDEPNLPWLLAHPNIEYELIQIDEQNSCIKFWWTVNQASLGGKK